MQKIKDFFSSLAGFFSKLFTKETLTSLFTPAEEYGKLFYWGFLIYFLANIFVSDFVSIILVAVMVFIYQVAMYAYKDRKLSVVDFVFAMLPAVITSIQIWL